MKQTINFPCLTTRNGIIKKCSHIPPDRHIIALENGVLRMRDIGVTKFYARADDQGRIRKIPNPFYMFFAVLVKLNLY